jgi:hypothetical protein
MSRHSPPFAVFPPVPSSILTTLLSAFCKSASLPSLRPGWSSLGVGPSQTSSVARVSVPVACSDNLPILDLHFLPASFGLALASLSVCICERGFCSRLLSIVGPNHDRPRQRRLGLGFPLLGGHWLDLVTVAARGRNQHKGPPSQSRTVQVLSIVPAWRGPF